MRCVNLWLLILIINPLYVSGQTTLSRQDCLGLKHSEDVPPCIENSLRNAKEKYEYVFNEYVKSINVESIRPYDKKTMTNLAKGAKKNWDTYLQKECLLEASVYDKDSTGFNDSYKLCFIRNYQNRISYYLGHLF